eukprot:gene30365-37950_t
MAAVARVNASTFVGKTAELKAQAKAPVVRHGVGAPVCTGTVSRFWSHWASVYDQSFKANVALSACLYRTFTELSSPVSTIPSSEEFVPGVTIRICVSENT